jgi:glycosyltransferase involved in cell wall biosynthesis
MTEPVASSPATSTAGTPTGPPWRVDVVLPVLNEAGAIPWVLERMPAWAHPIVVDNGSTDGSGELARTLGATVVAETRRGFGSACLAGLHATTAELVAFMDCDATLDPQELPALLDALAGADLVLGARQPEKGAWPAPARVANMALAVLLRRRRLKLRDLGPMRVARRAALVELDLRDTGSGFPLEMVLRAHNAGWTITEVPVRYRPRVGESKVTGSLRGCVRVARTMRETFRDIPDERSRP